MAHPDNPLDRRQYSDIRLPAFHRSGNQRALSAPAVCNVERVHRLHGDRENCMKASFLLRALILAISIAAFRPLFAPTLLKADVISTAQMQVGIGTNGNLFDSG